MLPVHNTESIISIYQTLISYYNSIPLDKRSLLSVNISFNDLVFKDELVEPDINLFRHISTLPQYCSGSNHGLIFTHMFPLYLLQSPKFINEHIFDPSNNTVILTPSSAFRFIQKNADNIKNLICNDILDTFPISSVTLVHLIQYDHNITTMSIYDLLLTTYTADHITSIFDQAVSSIEFLATTFPIIHMLTIGRSLTNKELISFVTSERINIMDLLSKEDLVHALRQT